MRNEMFRRILVRIVVGVALFGSAQRVDARKLDVSGEVPEFSATDVKGSKFSYPSDANEVLLVAFLSPAKPQSAQALSDLESMVDFIDKSPRVLSVLFVLEDDPNSASLVKIREEAPNPRVKKHLVVDQGYKLWGTFGVIAAPTVFLAGTDHKVTLVKAGYGYDFLPALRFHLNQALGIAQAMTAEEVGTVKTAQNSTASDRMQRHLKMAQMLQEKGKTDAALQQLEMARQADPNDLQVALQVGTLYCTSSQPLKALDAVENLKPSLRKEVAQVHLITGWAKRLLGDFPAAQEHLLKAAEADPGSARAFFELGQVYEVTSQQDLALKAYKKALSILMKDK